MDRVNVYNYSIIIIYYILQRGFSIRDWGKAYCIQSIHVEDILLVNLANSGYSGCTNGEWLIVSAMAMLRDRPSNAKKDVKGR